MSSLYKLSILGVRSFSPKDHETIQFGSPLTLICGQNGCGKTTIIECLKYATTGDLPPNSKGGAFVNDPVIADRLIVNAEIKLGYISVDGKLMTVTRNMQLTRKRGVRGSAVTNTFKTLEGQLAVISRGSKTSISTKNSELDTRVPQYLGASKAILEYVIFCHQDDSLWPLSEAGVLKKRFDEIFEALKFTKVLDNLKTIKKEMATDIKLIEQSVQHAKIDKVRAQKIREKLEESTATVEQYSLEIAELTIEIENLEKKADELFHLNQSFQKTLSEYDRLKLTLENTENNYLRLKNSIEVLTNSDQELAHQLANFAQIQQEKAGALKTKQTSKYNLDSQLSKTQTQFHELTRMEGTLDAKKIQFEENLEKLSELSLKISDQYQISQGLKKQEVMNELTEMHKVADGRYKQLVQNNKQDLGILMDELGGIRDKITKEDQHSLYCAEDIKNSNLKIRAFKEKLSTLALDDDALEMEKSKLESLKAKLDQKKGSSKVKSLEEEIDLNKRELSSLEMQLDDLMRKIGNSNKQSDIHSKIDLLKDSKSLKSNFLAKVTSSNQAEFKVLTGSDLNADGCEATLDACIRKLQVENEELQVLLGESSNDLSSMNARLDSTNKTLLDLEQKLKGHKSKILSILEEGEISDYEKLLQELEDDHKSAVYNLNTFEVTKSYKIKAMEIAKKTKSCTLCNRGFNSGELSKFETELQNNINSLTADKFTEDVEATMKDLRDMKDIHFDVLQYRKLTMDLQTMKTEVESQGEKIKEKTNQNDAEKKNLDLKKHDLDRVNELAKPIESIHRTFGEIASIDSQLLFLQDELEEFGSSTMTMSELQKEQNQKNFEVKSLRQAISDATEDINSVQRELSKLESQVKDKQLLISDLERAFSEAAGLKSSISDTEMHVKSLQEKQEKIGIILKDLHQTFKEKSNEFEDLKGQREKQEETSKSALEDLSSTMSSFEKIMESIQYYENNDKENVELIKDKLTKVTKEVQELEHAKTKLELEIRELEGAVNDATKVERNIQDNVELRQTEKELDKIQETLNQMDIQNAEVQKERYQVASQKLRSQITELNSQHFGKVGEVKQINDQIQHLQKELSTEFKNIDKKYHSEWIKLQTNLLVSNDLQTYSQALDNAIMKYHSMKMDEINRILRELWNQTYRGTDIDGIEIKCDVATGRSYNYRVVMYKKNSELDMRGRCSAGQKVLTSILIRLALAECFGTNCGMIALDEPTTNLDVENAESLAMALNNIIDFRKAQKNFQLIIITHDEQFLSHINGDRYTDNFYRIERNENQNSIIKSLPIHLMQDD